MARPRQHAPEELHARVMAACDEWLKTQPIHALSLRSIAREVGCAPSTLLKLYGSFSNLLQYVNIDTLNDLRERIDADYTCADPGQRIHRLAKFYWQFAHEHPYRWQLLFEHPLAQEGELDQRQNMMIEQLFVRVEQTLREIQPDLAAIEANRMARSLWGSVHGLVQLGLARRLGSWEGAPLEVDELLDKLLGTIIKGLRYHKE
ncbi:TetR/AcrR family transcriptional regulator [Larsenimonas salina]|uniref:TetR/AcrR family transcriptional regulator n=1 Tax=Larsenimonas salina TaxID=1295565 RepID=UPI002073429B|nr:TetR-like C-terminal domain-containing protein [Larsenimonas salina]MCM5705568.1 WHG domain-containing protein [Larsenimonas salina]